MNDSPCKNFMKDIGSDWWDVPPLSMYDLLWRLFYFPWSEFGSPCIMIFNHISLKPQNCQSSYFSHWMLSNWRFSAPYSDINPCMCNIWNCIHSYNLKRTWGSWISSKNASYTFINAVMYACMITKFWSLPSPFLCFFDPHLLTFDKDHNASQTLSI